VNEKSNFGDTPLTLAAENGAALETVLMLLHGGADPATPNASGNTPYQIARKMGFDEIAKILETRKASR